MSDEQGTVEHALWRDAGLGLAYLDRDGIVVTANAYFEACAHRKLAGVPFLACMAPAQHLAFHAALGQLGDGWRSLTLGLFPDRRDVPRDHRVSLRGEGSRVLVVAVPGTAGQEMLLERLLHVNADLLRARRSAQATKQAESAARVLRQCRAVSDPALGALPAHDLVAAVLARVVDVLGATGAVVLERRVRAGEAVLATTFAHGIVPGLGPPPAPQSLAGRLAVPDSPRVVRDPLSIRLLSPSLAATRARSLALVPLAHDGHWIGALHVGGSTMEAFGASDAVLWAAAARLGPAVAAAARDGRTGSDAPTGATGDNPGAAAACAPEAALPETAIVLDRPSGYHVMRAVLARLPGVPLPLGRIAGELVEALVATPPFLPAAGDPVTIQARATHGGLRVRLESSCEALLPGEPLNRVRGAARAWGFEREGGTRIWFEI